jgi:hypothetical protein
MDNMTKCKACGKEIAKGAKICPHCGKDQRNFFMKHKIISAIGIIVILGIIGEAVGNNSQKKVGENKSVSASVPNKSDSKSKTQTFKIGDIVQLKDYKVTVNKVRTGNGADGMQPEQGKQYFYVDCTIENTSSEEKAVSSILMFKVQDQDGRSYEQAIPGDQNGQLDGKVSAGQKISGEYVVKIPQGKTGLKLVFDSSVLSAGGQVIVNLN